MNIQKILLGVALVLGVVGLILPYSKVSTDLLAGTTRDGLVIDADTGRLTNGFALTVTADNSSFAGIVNSSGTNTTGDTNSRCVSVLLNASTTRYWLVVASTTGAASSTNFFAFATSTKPSSCSAQ